MKVKLFAIAAVALALSMVSCNNDPQEVILESNRLPEPKTVTVNVEHATIATTQTTGYALVTVTPAKNSNSYWEIWLKKGDVEMSIDSFGNALSNNNGLRRGEYQWNADSTPPAFKQKANGNLAVVSGVIIISRDDRFQGTWEVGVRTTGDSETTADMANSKVKYSGTSITIPPVLAVTP